MPAPASVRLARKGTSGATLVLWIGKATDGAPLDVTDCPTPPTVAVNGTPRELVAKPIWRADYLLLALAGDPVTDADDVVLAAPEGWATVQVGTNEAAKVAALADFHVGPGVGASLYGDLPGPGQTMRVGWVPSKPVDTGVVPTFNELSRESYAGGWKNVEGEQKTLRFKVASMDERGYENLPPGDFLATWTGDGPIELIPDASSGTRPFQLVEDGYTPGSDGPHRRVYRTSRDHPRAWTQLAVRRRGQAKGPSVRVYLPGTDPADPDAHLWNPTWLERMRTRGPIRSLGLMETNETSITRFEHYLPPDAPSFEGSVKSTKIQATVAQVDPYADVYLPDSDTGIVFKVTTAEPHGLDTGQTPQFRRAGGASMVRLPVRLDNGNTDSLAILNIKVLSPTEFASRCQLANKAANRGAKVVPGQRPTGYTINLDITPELAPALFARLCADLEAPPWVCVPHAMIDDGVAKLADAIIAGTPAWQDIYVECSNEPWNYAPGFIQSQFFLCEGLAANLSAMQFYARRASEMHEVWEARMVAAGRDPARMLRTFNVQATQPVMTSWVVNWLKSNGKRCDRIAIAPYLFLEPEGGIDPPGKMQGELWLNRYEKMSIDQLMDIEALGVESKVGMVAAHYARLAPAFPDAKVACYEGSIQGIGRQMKTRAIADRSRTMALHPRRRDTVLRYLYILALEGCVDFCWLNPDTPATNSYFDTGGFMGTTWGAWWGAAQKTGYGDGRDGGFVNMSDPLDYKNVEAVVGRAIWDWVGLMEQEPVPHWDFPRPSECDVWFKAAGVRGGAVRYAADRHQIDQDGHWHGVVDDRPVTVTATGLADPSQVLAVTFRVRLEPAEPEPPS